MAYFLLDFYVLYIYIIIIFVIFLGISIQFLFHVERYAPIQKSASFLVCVNYFAINLIVIVLARNGFTSDKSDQNKTGLIR